MDNKANKVKRGEIYYYDFGSNEGSIQNGQRPVLVIQCDEGNKVSTTTIVAPITTVLKKSYLPSHIFLSEDCGLKKPSMVLLEQLRAVNQADLLDRVGIVEDDAVIRQINSGMRKALGLWVNKHPDKDDVRCLCSNCLRDLMTNKDIVIKRYDPYSRIKERCDKCNGTGYEYLIVEKHPNK